MGASDGTIMVDRAGNRDLLRLFTRAGFAVNTGIVPAHPGAVIEFRRDDKRFRFVCSKHDYLLDNLRAAQLAITTLYRVYETYGVSDGSIEDFHKLFGGHLLASGEDWWQVLGVPRTATRLEVDMAFRRQAGVTHPDRGGTNEAFIRVQRAYQAAVAEIEGEGR